MSQIVEFSFRYRRVPQKMLQMAEKLPISLQMLQMAEKLPISLQMLQMAEKLPISLEI
jgi:hypothetical protein